MDYRIIAADKNVGQIQVTYSQNGEDLATYAIDVPVVDGAYITGAALDAEIMSRAPTWLAGRKQEVATADFSQLEALVVSPTPTVVVTLDAAKALRIKKINAYREDVLAAGVTFKGYQFDSDPQSVSRLTSVASAVSAGISLPSGFVWRSSANIDVPMTATEVVQLLATMIQTADQVYRTSWEKKQAVSAAQSIADVNSVTWVVSGVTGGVL